MTLTFQIKCVLALPQFGEADLKAFELSKVIFVVIDKFQATDLQNSFVGIPILAAASSKSILVLNYSSMAVLFIFKSSNIAG